MIQFDANGHVLEEGFGGWNNTNYSVPQMGNGGWGYGISNKKDKDGNEDEKKASEEEMQYRSTMLPPGMMRAYSPLYPMMPQYLPAAMPAAGYIPAF